MDSENTDDSKDVEIPSSAKMQHNQNMVEKNEKSIIVDKKEEKESGSSDISIAQEMMMQEPQPNNNLVNVHIESQLDAREIQEYVNCRHPLEMIDIVPLVLKRMDSSSLKSSLMVSHLWKAEGIKLFLEKNYFQVPVNFHKDDNDDIIVYTDQEKDTIIEQVKETLSNYTGVLNLNLRDALDVSLFQKVEMNGEQVHEVKLCPLFYKGTEGDEDKIDPLNSQLCTFCPHMKLLDTFLIFETGEYELPIRLKFGTCLMYSCIEFGFGQKDKPLTLTHLSSVSMDEDQFLTLEQFSQTGVQVMNFYLHFSSRSLEEDDLNLKAMECTMKILETSQDVLQSYSFNGSDTDCSSSFDMPILPHLRSLTIDLKLEPAPPGVPLLFSHNFKFIINTPILEDVSFSILPDPTPNDEEFLLDRIFEHTGKATSVKRLHYINKCERLETGRFFETFSEIEKLTVDNGKIDWKNVWNNCRKLKYLECSVELKDQDEGFDFLSKFLGFSLKDTIRIFINPELNEKIQVSSSILNLKDLEELTIIFDDVFSTEFGIMIWSIIQDYQVDYMPKKIKRAQAFHRRTTIIQHDNYQDDDSD